ncbi:MULTISPECIES: histidine kinase [Limosilactobacillus]|uniref:histidine kinase n=1 Tax=Limosilactobacillus TaxID=2742598 RepID=UPI0021B1FDB1|nr:MULTISPECIES: histidine kinase [Limosilactobacillus]MDM8219259.1 histidine kinase [Limosilactobacillus mucosae]MDM8313915.1 histidine kinase [Limosilactobacillus mucosae]UXC67000.1 histidine kinase [Limosilactobacillus oris]
MMAFDVIIASDQQIDAMLHSIKRIPTWKLENTQSEREHKRIHQLQLHQQQLEQDKEAETERKKQRRIIAVPKVQTKKPLSHQGNDLEL